MDCVPLSSFEHARTFYVSHNYCFTTSVVPLPPPMQGRKPLRITLYCTGGRMGLFRRVQPAGGAYPLGRFPTDPRHSEGLVGPPTEGDDGLQNMNILPAPAAAEREILSADIVSALPLVYFTSSPRHAFPKTKTYVSTVE